MQIPLSPFWTAMLYGVIVGASLVIGGLIARQWNLPNHLVGAMLAFAAGALIAAIGLELVFVPSREIGALPVIAAVAGGAVVFSAVDFILAHFRERGGWGLIAEQTTEGIPESLAVGASAGGAGLTLFAAVALANVPEGLSGVVDFRERRIGGNWGVMAWIAVAVGLFAAVMTGYVVGLFTGKTLTAVFNAVAGGAALAGVASELMPEAYSRSGVWVSLSTVAGFLVSFWLFSVNFEGGG